MRNIFSNEMELLQGVNEKNTYALDQFFVSLQSKAIVIAKGVVKDDHIAQQLVHDVHLAFIKMPIEFKSLKKARNYFYTSASNAALNYIQSAQYKKWNKTSGTFTDVSDDTDNETALAKKGILNEIQAIIKIFPEKHQRIYNLTITGHKTDEVANEVGEDEQYVRNTRNKVFKKILKILRLKNLIMLL